MRRSLGKAGVSHDGESAFSWPWRLCQRILNERERHGGIERDIILKQMNCGAAEEDEARKERGSPIRV